MLYLDIEFHHVSITSFLVLDSILVYPFSPWLP